MVEHCPDWAKDEIRIQWLVNNPFFRDFMVENDDEVLDWRDADCMTSQRFAEWLELDQIDCSGLNEKYYQTVRKYKMIRKIRFFTDEV